MKVSLCLLSMLALPIFLSASETKLEHKPPTGNIPRDGVDVAKLQAQPQGKEPSIAKRNQPCCTPRREVSVSLIEWSIICVCSVLVLKLLLQAYQVYSCRCSDSRGGKLNADHIA